MKKNVLFLTICASIISVLFGACYVYKVNKNRNLKHIVLLGKPGCGKGTQAKLLKEKYNLYHIDGGQLLRNCVKNNCKYTEEIKNAFISGTLVKNDIMDYIVKQEFDDKLYCLTCNYNGAIIDGMPRNLDTIAVFEKNKIALEAVINLNVSNEVSKNRVLSRKNNRSDDNEQTLIKRLKTFEEKTSPVFNYYKQKGLYVEIDANGTQDEVFFNTTKFLDKIYKK